MQNNEPIWFNGNENTKEIKLEDFNKQKEPIKIFVAIPCHSEMSIHTVQSLLVLQQECIQKRIIISFSLMKSSLVQQGRNLLVSEFMNDSMKYDYLLFIDSDIDFQSKTIFKMIEKDKDIIACPYPMKTFDWDKAWNRLHKEGQFQKSWTEWLCESRPELHRVQDKAHCMQVHAGNCHVRAYWKLQSEVQDVRQVRHKLQEAGRHRL